MPCSSFGDPLELMTVPDAGSNRTGIVSLYVKGTPMVAVVWPGGFCLLIFSTGTKRFWQPALSVLDELLVNQIWCPRTALHDILPVNTTLSKMMSHLWLFVPGLV